ncbi:hypothetical protein RPC_1996 [Rhodopseudomonas palustris BisB18]|uniref:Transposase n=1 Tax=Rhodopseudomonas palustris (strain BisB18) TaxID=316056 RepID=Q216Y4_RHOPB
MRGLPDGGDERRDPGMSRRLRRNHTPAFKGCVGGYQGRSNAGSSGEHVGVHPSQITTWKAQLEGGFRGLRAMTDGSD